jgi:hypothetical protein
LASVALSAAQLASLLLFSASFCVNKAQTPLAKKPSSVKLTSSLNPSTYGQAVTLTATVTPSAATGTVTFKDGTKVLGTKTLADGVARGSSSTLSAGVHSLTAVYSGDSDYSGSTSPVLDQKVNKAATSVTLTSSLNPSTYGSAVTFTAKVTPSSATGSVVFNDGTNSLGTVTLGNNGTASLTTSALLAGTHSITAVYSGNTDYNGSTSPPLTQTVNKAAASVTLTSSLNPSPYGVSVTFTATVTPSAATGTVTFDDGTTVLGTATLSGGIAQLTTMALAVGSHSITAVYSGDSNYLGSTSPPLTQTVTKAATSVSLTSSLNPSTYGQAVTFTATATPSAATGSVTFSDGTTSLGTVTISGGTASLTTSTLLAGSHSITAAYSGNANYNGSTSPVLTQTVNKAATSVSLTSSLNPSTYGQTVTFTATVTPSTATGSVTFTDGTTNLGTVTINGGTASLTTSALLAGSHSITAAYGGDSNDNGSTSPALTQTVNKAASSVTVTSSLNPSTYGASVTFTATVTGTGATGTVTFYDGTTELGTGGLSNGTASYSTSSLAGGTHAITAVYGGDGNYTGSTSPVLNQVVNLVLLSITVSPQGLSAAVGSAGQQYTATGNYNDGSSQNITNAVTWASSNMGAATVTSAGIVSAVAQGASTISAMQGTVTGSSALTVYPVNTFFVATNGNDTWMGDLSAPNANNTDGPFASPAQARLAVENAAKGNPIAVLLRAGTYYLPLSPTNPGTLVFNGSADSGTSSAAQATWQNYPGETPVISGGVPANADPVSGVGLHLTWTHGSGNLWQAQLPANVQTGVPLQDFEYLIYNGQRRLRARVQDSSYPSVGYYMSGPGTCVATPQSPAGQPAPTLTSCNLGTFLRVAATIPYNSNGSTCTLANSASDGSGDSKCLDRFVYTPTSPDTIGQWLNLYGTYTGPPSNPCSTSSNPYPPGDIELTLFDAWTVDVMRVNCVDTQSHIIYLTGATKGSGQNNSNNYNFFGPTVNHRYIIENTLDAFQEAQTMQQVGVWFLDRHVQGAWVLNYLADTAKGENPPTDNIVIPQLGGSFPGAPATDYIGGSLISATQLNYATFQGITFEADNFIPSATGFNNDINGELSLPQAIDCESCQNVTFNGVTVRHTSASGILFASSYGYKGPAATADTIENSTLYDIGDSAVRIGHTTVVKGNLDNSLYVVNNIVVQNNLIQGYSRVFPDGEGIAEGNGNSNQFINNTITDGYHAAISVCQVGCGPYNANGTSENGNSITSQFNLISNLMQGITADGGSLYYNIGNVIGTTGGSGASGQILSNVIYDNTDSYIIDVVSGVKVSGTGYGGEGIYLDSQTADVTVENNVVYNVDGHGIHLTEGVVKGQTANTFSNNIFAFANSGMFTQDDPWPQGCYTPGLQVNVTDNIFEFDRNDQSTPSFYAVGGCTNSCGQTYSAYQNFQGNAYWRTDGGFASDKKAFEVLKTQDLTGGTCSGANTQLSFSTPSPTWQLGGTGVPVAMQEDVNPSGTASYNPGFPATGLFTDLPAAYSFSANHLAPPPTPFQTNLTDAAIAGAGSSLPSLGSVPPTFPTYTYPVF